jgi:hypothetical protein
LIRFGLFWFVECFLKSLSPSLSLSLLISKILIGKVGHFFQIEPSNRYSMEPKEINRYDRIRRSLPCHIYKFNRQRYYFTVYDTHLLLGLTLFCEGKKKGNNELMSRGSDGLME